MMDKMIIIVGPTASGKTALSVALAKALNGEIISADSMQIYRGMDIGTAKVTAEEMEGIPHHMVDVAEPWENYSAARFVSEADAAVQDILSRGKTVIVAGGTGLWVDSLVAGRSFAPYPETGKRQALEQEAEEKGMEFMLRRLQTVDPDSAERLHTADRKRIIRALEVYEETGKTITEHNRETRLVPDRYTPLWLGLNFEDRQVLYDRINLRIDQMLEDGLVDEVQALKEKGYTRDMVSMQGLGYKEILDYLNGNCTLDEAIYILKRDTRHFAKRQLTWFRRERDVIWIDKNSYNYDENKILEAMLESIRERTDISC